MKLIQQCTRWGKMILVITSNAETNKTMETKSGEVMEMERCALYKARVP